MFWTEFCFELPWLTGTICDSLSPQSWTCHLSLNIQPLGPMIILLTALCTNLTHFMPPHLHHNPTTSTSNHRHPPPLTVLPPKSDTNVQTHIEADVIPKNTEPAAGLGKIPQNLTTPLKLQCCWGWDLSILNPLNRMFR